MVSGIQTLTANLLASPDGEVSDIASLQQVLRDWAAENEAIIGDSGLIMGFGYDNSQLAELRHSTKEELDAVSTEFAVYLVHQSRHIGATNSKALEVLGITAALLMRLRSAPDAQPTPRQGKTGIVGKGKEPLRTSRRRLGKRMAARLVRGQAGARRDRTAFSPSRRGVRHARGRSSPQRRG
jgi:predicted amidohydrolase YtcJ